MAWGWKRHGNPDSFEDRYRAVARLIARRGFEPQGLTVIEVDGGFVVRGLRTIGRRYADVTSDTISAEELLAEVDNLGR
jgi:hypothetical protein